MIDEDDAVIALWAMNPTSLVGFIFAAVVVGVLAWAACDNAKDCAAQRCEHGTARLLDGECVCAEAPK